MLEGFSVDTVEHGPEALHRIGAGLVKRMDRVEVGVQCGRGKRMEAHEGTFRELMRRHSGPPDHHAGDNLMGASGKLRQHAQGILPVRWLAKETAVHPDDGVCGNDGFAGKPAGDRTDFAAGIFEGQRGRRERVVLEFLRAGHNAAHINTGLFQKMFAAG